ncbi:hypothetical protein [Streptomyces sp. NPDC057363]|uniref:hypothetical protein n=1 Tax=Streptomyces sp. NPDC057363 TaxID=3346107 RepID=UPI0036370778
MTCRGRATSVITSVSYLGFLLGPVYVGLWADATGLRGAMIAVAALAAALSLLALPLLALSRSAGRRGPSAKRERWRSCRPRLSQCAWSCLRFHDHPHEGREPARGSSRVPDPRQVRLHCLHCLATSNPPDASANASRPVPRALDSRRCGTGHPV